MDVAVFSWSRGGPEKGTPPNREPRPTFVFGRR